MQNSIDTLKSLRQSNLESSRRLLIRELVRLADGLRRTGDHRNSTRYLLEALTHASDLCGDRHPITLSLRLKVARMMALLGHSAEARSHRAIALTTAA